MGQQAEVITSAGGGVSWGWAGWSGLIWTGQYKGVCGCQSWKQLLINLEGMNGGKKMGKQYSFRFEENLETLFGRVKRTKKD